jgi:FkbM family methyltransferase
MIGSALRAIQSGERIRDKIAIGLLMMRVALFPLARLRRFGIYIPDPGTIIRSYACRSGELVIRCPGQGGAHFLFSNPRYDSVRSLMDETESGTVIDVGAHLGFYSLHVANRLGAKGRVVAIEPHPLRFGFLNENVALNRIVNVVCLPYAVGDHSGSATLYDVDSSIGPHATDASLEPSRGTRFEVPLRTLDSICDEHHLDSVILVKIDVEGHEARVIDGMSQLIQQQHPRIIFEALTRESLQASTERLRSFGYEIRQIDSGNYVAESVHSR